MAKSRIELQALLEEILGSRNVYFQPPENIKLKYPCIIYSFAKFHTKKADNRDYLRGRRYEITLIHTNPDNEVVDKLQDLQYCDLDRPFVSDNLYHYTFTLFY